MSVKDEAVKFHNSGYNCAQSVFCACCKYTGLDFETAAAVSSGFGGGVRCGEMCGAFTGAVMALGASRKMRERDDAQEYMKTVAKEFTGELKKKFGKLRCDDIKGRDYTCNQLIAYAAELAEKYIKNF